MTAPQRAGRHPVPVLGQRLRLRAAGLPSQSRWERPGRTWLACIRDASAGLLNAFSCLVEAQHGQEVAPAAAELLLAYARNLIALAECRPGRVYASRTLETCQV
jgi:hypothetical protein